ncbi:MAG: SRPBCC family protein [Bdellovibrionales bacterium]
MFAKILAFLALLLGGLAVAIALQPEDFSVRRVAVMNAQPQVVFDQVNDFHKWEAWSPWAKMDPNATTTFSGSNAGTGAVMEWSGNHEVGAGRMTIAESTPPDRILIDLEFTKPFAAISTTEFTFTPTEEGGTLAAWTMSGKNNFIGKAFSLFMDCEKTVGGQFEKGLASIKEIVEK